MNRSILESIPLQIRRSTKKPGKFSVFLSGTSIIAGATLKFCRSNARPVAMRLMPGQSFTVSEYIK